MTEQTAVFTGGPIFDGEKLRHEHAAIFEDGRLKAITPVADLDYQATRIDLSDDILSPGFTDLQVNGGGGVMLNDDPCVETVERIAAAHRTLGTRALLPTLITDTAEKTRAAIAAVKAAVAKGVPGIAGLHLEGPHLSVARKGAHDAAYIRPMEDTDLQALLQAAKDLPALMVTVAAENVTLDQVTALHNASAIVSLGHTDADFDTCLRYIHAGARCATHLFNAMSQLGNREPGLVGAVLASEQVSSGLIADGIHVHPVAMRTAWTAKTKPGEIFLVSDAMAVAGTNDRHFDLDGRRVYRADGRLMLENGTLAGADLDMVTAIRALVEQVGVDLRHALRAATSVPQYMLGNTPAAISAPRDEFIRIRPDLTAVSPL